MGRNEFEFIKNIKDRFGLGRIGDDCAVLPRDESTDLVVTTDMLVEGIDFRLDWTTPEFLGHKALAVSLSDIAAMGGMPEWAMLSIGVPPGLWEDDFLDRFYVGWHDLAAEHGVELVGGDVSRVPDQFVIDSIVGGTVPKDKAVRRSGAKAGDDIYVTGPLGGAAAGLQFLKDGVRIGSARDEATRSAIFRQLRPVPLIDAGVFLRRNSIASSMIDISDGLSSDLNHLIAASGVGALILAGSIPIADGHPNSQTRDGALENALHGGEDLELLFTADPKKNLAERSSNFHRIGTITANTGIIELTTASETRVLAPKGYRHF
ncbi:MAG TPA: thiamine-phosphate kinase [Pyrinomonadaceae bacterium]|mgnify:CR=1 FL=1|nr:thiamine-phosphate kinase [Pyrinomonadaceae bacterium]